MICSSSRLGCKQISTIKPTESVVVHPQAQKMMGFTNSGEFEDVGYANARYHHHPRHMKERTFSCFYCKDNKSNGVLF
jgi:hypothetical protein